MPPPSSVPSSWPTLARSRPRSATCSRSITTRASGRSIFRSVSTYRNLPLCQPAPTTCPTVSSICSGGASLRSTSSTSYRPGVGRGGSRRGKTRTPGICDTAPNTSPYISSVERFALLPVLGHQATEAAPGGSQRPHEVGLGERPDGANHVQRGAIVRHQRRVGWRLEEQEDVALVFDRGELPPGEAIQRPGRGHHHDNRGRHDRPTHLERSVEQLAVSLAHGIEATVHQRGEPAFLAVGVHEARAHHW